MEQYKAEGRQLKMDVICSILGNSYEGKWAIWGGQRKGLEEPSPLRSVKLWDKVERLSSGS